MTVASTLLCLGFALLIALGLFALGLVIAASFFALLAAGTDCVRVITCICRGIAGQWRRLGSAGRQFTLCWSGIALCAALALVHRYVPRAPDGAAVPLDGLDLLGCALCLPALAQIVDRWKHRWSANP